jgi:hypothetical protein
MHLKKFHQPVKMPCTSVASRLRLYCFCKKPSTAELKLKKKKKKKKNKKPEHFFFFPNKIKKEQSHYCNQKK